MRFSVSDVAVDPHTILLEAHGDLDLYTSPELDERIGAAVASGVSCVVVDLNDVPFVDSSGLAVLIVAERRITATHGVLVIVCAEAARRLFEMKGVVELLRVVDSRDLALAAARDLPRAG